MTSSGDHSMHPQRGYRSNKKDLLVQMLKVENEIQKAILEISNQEAIFEDVCQEIQSSLGFDFTVISLVNPEKNTIKTVYESGFVPNLSIKCKYYLEKNPDLRDILADLVQTCHTEIISGWDSRFDRWVYEEYEHETFVRVFTPIILVQDQNGNIIEDWFKKYKWEVVTEKQTDDGYRTVIQTRLLVQDNQNLGNIQVIGAINAGYTNRDKQITVEQAIALAKLVAQQSLKIRRTQMSYLLETIAEIARSNLKAGIAAVDFMYKSEQKDYIYKVVVGNIDQNSWNDFLSRKQVLEQEVLREKKPKFISGKKAVTVLPLQVDDEEGILFLEFTDERKFTENEINLLNLFLNRSASAIRRVMVGIENHAHQTDLTNLYLFNKSLIHKTEKEVLLQRIVSQIGNILGADAVVFNEYDDDENKFPTPLKIAGRLINQESKYSEIGRNDKSLMLIKHGTNIYASPLDSTEIFKDSNFVKQENIKSVAALLLKVSEEIVGVIFVYYRRIHNFSKNEKKLIETLASYAAYAINNQQWLNSWLQIFSDIERELITTLEEEKLLNLIVQRAVEKTKADFGSITLLQFNNQELETKALYPKNSKKEEIGMRKSIEKGITGRVARNRRAELVNDVRQDPNYRELFPTVRSELCVPLLNKENFLLGVLNVESNKVNAFDPRDLRLLQDVANLAVIGIQNAKKQEKLAKTEAMATLGDIAGPLVHRTNNDVGAIRVFAQDICEQADKNIKSSATDILSIAEKILEYSQRMKSWMKDQPQIISLRDIIQETLAKVQIPDNIEQNININLNLSQVFAGKQQLINVFDNLIRNAINAMPNGGKLSIQGSNLEIDAGNKIKVIICDTGVGIAKENLQKIFEAGYSTKDTNKNMGFGLWWTKFYIERLEGDIEVESEVGKGSQFTLILPAYKQEV